MVSFATLMFKPKRGVIQTAGENIITKLYPLESFIMKDGNTTKGLGEGGGKTRR